MTNRALGRLARQSVVLLQGWHRAVVARAPSLEATGSGRPRHSGGRFCAPASGRTVHRRAQPRPRAQAHVCPPATDPTVHPLSPPGPSRRVGKGNGPRCCRPGRLRAVYAASTPGRRDLRRVRDRHRRHAVDACDVLTRSGATAPGNQRVPCRSFTSDGKRRGFLRSGSDRRSACFTRRPGCGRGHQKEGSDDQARASVEGRQGGDGAVAVVDLRAAQTRALPASVKIGPKAVGWFEDEVLDYLKSRPRVGADRATNRR